MVSRNQSDRFLETSQAGFSSIRSQTSYKALPKPIHLENKKHLKTQPQICEIWEGVKDREGDRPKMTPVYRAGVRNPKDATHSAWSGGLGAA